MTSPDATHDVIVFSGGGFKGAYGAGAAKAIMEYRAFKEIGRELCYVGNSAGALNAAVLAAASADDLIRFWLEVTREDILGNDSASLSGVLWGYAGWSLGGKQEYYSIYSNQPRRKFMKSRIDFERLKGKHLIVTATDFIYAQARAFYTSELIEKFKKEDDKRSPEDRRLAHCSPILNQQQLLNALTASSAIPLAFPPVEIEYERNGQKVKSLFVDGGVGNNVPTREGAYFHRFLGDLKLGVPGDTYCIELSPPRIAIDELKRDFLPILARAYDVYDYIHMNAIVKTWYRINREVKRWKKLDQEFNAWLEKEVADEALRKKIAEAAQVFRPKQHDLPFLEVEPSASLGATLDFSPKRIRDNIKMGHDDVLIALCNRGDITKEQRDEMINSYTIPARP